MRIVFMGTPDFAASILRAIAPVHDVVAVYTRADAVRGRGKKLLPSPVKTVAEGLGIPVRTPATLRDADVVRELADAAPDAICVAAYGMILPREVLDIPRLGCLNVHASLLPRWRGAAPVERAILAGDEEAGVCVMRMEEGLDTGDYCICRAIDVADTSAPLLTDQLADLGAHALLTALSQAEAGVIRWTAQEAELVTYAAKIERGELDLSPADDACVLCRKVQASSEAHPSHAVVAGKRVTVLVARGIAGDARAAEFAKDIAPGQVRFAGKRLFIGAADGAVELLSVKPDGKQAMEAKAFAAGIQGIKDGNKIWEGPRG